MKGQYVVAGYQGNMYYRFVPDNSTTVYADQELASFDNELDAKDFVTDNEDSYYDTYWDCDEEDDGDDWGDDVNYFVCDGCGALHINDCKCDND